MAFELPEPKIKPWRRVERESVARYSIFGVDRLRLEPPNGAAARDFYTVQTADFCNVVALTDDDEVVLLWQYRFGTEAFSLETPGGMIDPRETPEDAARRELREESGYEAGELEPLMIFEAAPSIEPSRCFVFVARGAKRVAEPAFDAYEECEVTLVPRAAIPALLDAGRITSGHICAVLERFLRRHGA